MATNFGSTGSTGTTTPRTGTTGQEKTGQPGQIGSQPHQGATGQQTPRPEEHREGSVARSIEHQTAKLPSDWFLWSAVGAMSASLLLQMSNRKEMSNFVGQWAPTFLILGLYNKIVKVAGSDQVEQQQQRRSGSFNY